MQSENSADQNSLVLDVSEEVLDTLCHLTGLEKFTDATLAGDEFALFNLCTQYSRFCFATDIARNSCMAMHYSIWE